MLTLMMQDKSYEQRNFDCEMSQDDCKYTNCYLKILVLWHWTPWKANWNYCSY